MISEDWLEVVPMKKLMNHIDKFCYKHPRFGIPNLMLFIVIGNGIVWLFSAMDTTGLLECNLAFSARQILQGQVWRLLTFVLVPQSSGFWLLIMLYFYYFIGSTLEREWGSGRFTIYYLAGMFLTALYGFITYFVTGESYAITASYINLSMFFAFATLFPETQFCCIYHPHQMKWLAILNAA
jgi:membrane associated rhomboid family serine protease